MATPGISHGARLTVLGVESSCDETAAAIVQLAGDQVDVLSDVVASQTDAHAVFGGVVPEIAARAHADQVGPVVAKALYQAGLAVQDVDAVAATAGPGLIGGVLVGFSYAKGLALGAGKPLIAVNHLEGHALSPLLSEPVRFPYLLLLVSGGHTQLLKVEGVGVYRRLGSTRDDAAGEAFDKIAKVLGLGFPGGPAMEKAAQTGDATRFDLPRAFVGEAHCDFSFSGLKSAALRAYEAIARPDDQDKADLAASLQATIADIVEDRCRSALAMVAQDTTPPTALVVAGGVAANAHLRTKLAAFADAAGLGFFAPPMKWCTDNAAMIALAGALKYRAGATSGFEVSARPRWPLDREAAKETPSVGAGRKGPKA